MQTITSAKDLHNSLTNARENLDSTILALDNIEANKDQYCGTLSVWGTHFDKIIKNAALNGQVGLQLVAIEINKNLESMQDSSSDLIISYSQSLKSWIDQVLSYLKLYPQGTSNSELSSIDTQSNEFLERIDNLLVPIPSHFRKIIKKSFLKQNSFCIPYDSEANSLYQPLLIVISEAMDILEKQYSVWDESDSVFLSDNFFTTFTKTIDELRLASQLTEFKALFTLSKKFLRKLKVSSKSLTKPSRKQAEECLNWLVNLFAYLQTPVLDSCEINREAITLLPSLPNDKATSLYTKLERKNNEIDNINIENDNVDGLNKVITESKPSNVVAQKNKSPAKLVTPKIINSPKNPGLQDSHLDSDKTAFDFSSLESDIGKMLNETNDVAEKILEEETFDIDAMQDIVGDLSLAKTSTSSSLAEEIVEPLEQEKYDLTSLIGIFQQEITELHVELRELLSNLEADDILDEYKSRLLDQYIKYVGRLSKTSIDLGFSGLDKVCNFITTNFKEDYAKSKYSNNSSQYSDWLLVILKYLSDPQSDERCINVITFFQQDIWPKPLDDLSARNILSELAKASIDGNEINEEQPRKKVAAKEDVNLSISETSSAELVSAFFKESPMIASNLSTCITDISNKRDVQENIASAQRFAHTLKGSAGLLGVAGIANLTHHLEDILEYLNANPKQIPSQLFLVLQDATDCVESMLDVMRLGESEADNAIVILQSVLDWANQMDKGELAENIVTAKSEPESGLELRLGLKPEIQSEVVVETEKNVALKDLELIKNPGKIDSDTESAVRKLATEKEVIPNKTKKVLPKKNSRSLTEESIYVPTKLIDNIHHMLGEMTIKNNQINEYLKNIKNQDVELQIQNRSFHRCRAELEDLVNIQRFSSIQRNSKNKKFSGDNFDSLELDQYDELYGSLNSLIENMLDTNEIHRTIQSQISSLEDAVASQQQINSELQQIALNARMISVSSIIPRLQRTVRQASRSTEKQVELLIEGDELYLDSEILNNLTDPIMHILRNAVDHGIESSKERLKLGKPETGKITIAFNQIGNEILVVCTDDGAGLDYKKIAKAAIARKLIGSREKNNKLLLTNLILQPGFTTRDKVTQLSGRGVGMDIVNNVIQSYGGVIRISENKPYGCEIRLRVPINMVTTHSLLIKDSNRLYAFPSNSIHQVVLASENSIIEKQGEQYFTDGENVYPAVFMNALTNRRKKFKSSLTRVALLIKNDSAKVNAIIVDQVVSSNKLVIKEPSQFIPQLPGLSGLSILGDGQIVPVMNPKKLLAKAVNPVLGQSQYNDSEQEVVEETILKVLIVDDSISVRKSLKELVEDVGYKAIVARNGVEAIDLLHKNQPDIVLTDLEMPKMTGLELTSNIRADKCFVDLPIIMITSRASQKHRQQAEKVGVNKYLTKPYTEDELLDLINSFVGKTYCSTKRYNTH